MELGFFRQIESKGLNFLRKDFGGVVTEKKQQCRQNQDVLLFIHRGMTSSATDMPLLRGLEWWKWVVPQLYSYKCLVINILIRHLSGIRALIPRGIC